jgi:hypothetical protein
MSRNFSSLLSFFNNAKTYLAKATGSASQLKMRKMLNILEFKGLHFNDPLLDPLSQRLVLFDNHLEVKTEKE